VRTILLAGAAFALLSGAAHATDKKPVEWFTYVPSTQVCVRDVSPPKVIEQARLIGKPDPTVKDVTDDDGKVIAVMLVYPDDINPRMVVVVRMFREKVACQRYADSRKIDTGKYE
jgi:hypothetical protein